MQMFYVVYDASDYAEDRISSGCAIHAHCSRFPHFFYQNYVALDCLIQYHSAKFQKITNFGCMDVNEMYIPMKLGTFMNINSIQYAAAKIIQAITG